MTDMNVENESYESLKHYLNQVVVTAVLRTFTMA